MIWELIKGTIVVGTASSGAIFGYKYFSNEIDQASKVLEPETKRKEGFQREKDGEEEATLHTKKQFNCLLNAFESASNYQNIKNRFQKYEIKSGDQSCPNNCERCS